MDVYIYVWLEIFNNICFNKYFHKSLNKFKLKNVFCKVNDNNVIEEFFSDDHVDHRGQGQDGASSDDSVAAKTIIRY